ncbi:polysaccharide deacetylase family protein [Paramagnetospirillum magnetotacticum]|nr:polysaccharide deacetylase family protein [Paramagnetospirillum magnetotacticum]
MRRLIIALCVLLVPQGALAWPSWLPFGPKPSALSAKPPSLDFGDKAKAGDCAITFDDGPGPHTGALLDLLAARKVKATFFVLGQHARRYPDLIRRMLTDGHEVENHSWDHPDMRKLDEAARRKEIEDTLAELKALGAEPHYFRPPYGAYDPDLVGLARKEGLELVLWSRDSEDWRYHTVSALEGNILPVGQGAHGIFLFHDIHDSTIAAMGGVLDDLGKRGCRFVTVWQFRSANATPQPLAQPQAPDRPIPPQ